MARDTRTRRPSGTGTATHTADDHARTWVREPRNYDQALAHFNAGDAPVPDVVATRQHGRVKAGAGLNVEHADPHAFRLAARAGWNECHHESFAYTEVNNTMEGGGDLMGRAVEASTRPAGYCGGFKRIADSHRAYLAAGGQGFLLGDGRLTYGRDNIVEKYYNVHIYRGMSSAAALQRITNPGYNQDRGPITVGTCGFLNVGGGPHSRRALQQPMTRLSPAGQLRQLPSSFPACSARFSRSNLSKELQQGDFYFNFA